MADGAATTFPSVTGAVGARAAGSDELAQGLLLMRASTLKMIRLQLAMERRDRREALETVDELVLLDRRIGNLLHDLPIASPPIVAARDEIEAQGAALARERFTLAAGITGPVLAPRPAWVEPPREKPVLETKRAGAELVTVEESRGRSGISSGFAGGLLLLVLILVVATATWLISGGGNFLIAGAM